MVVIGEGSSESNSSVWPTLPPWDPQTIPQMFESTAQRVPNRPAIISVDGYVSYGELARDVHRLATAFLELGVEPGAKIALWLPNYPEWVVCNLAIAAVGAVTVPLNARFRERETERVLKAADISILITTDSFLSNHYLDIVSTLVPEALLARDEDIRSDRFPALRRIITVRSNCSWSINYEELLEGGSGDVSDELRRRISAGNIQDPVDMFWTSGSTGEPKGAVISHAVLENIWNYNHILGYTEDDRSVVATPLFYGTGHYWCMLTSLMCGGAMVLLREFTPEEVLTAVEREKATTLVGSPTTFLGFVTALESVGADTSSLRLAWVGGAHFPLSLAQDMKRLMQIDVVGQVYGMTEVAGIATMTRPSDTLEDVASTVGYPMPGFELRLVDPDSGMTMEHGPGELWIRSHMNLLTYYGMPEAEVATYFAGDGWYRTGDILERDANGRYRFASRLKDILKVGGENVSTSEIEQVLVSHPRVHQAIVVGIPDKKRGEVPAAVIQAVGDVTESELRDWCKARMAPFKLPRQYVFRLEMPTTTTGKIDRPGLKAELLKQFE
jgi:fatty-acyl-CoA synthase